MVLLGVIADEFLSELDFFTVGGDKIFKVSLVNVEWRVAAQSALVLSVGTDVLVGGFDGFLDFLNPLVFLLIEIFFEEERLELDENGLDGVA
jgi:hypothetical protein